MLFLSLSHCPQPEHPLHMCALATKGILILFELERGKWKYIYSRVSMDNTRSHYSVAGYPLAMVSVQDAQDSMVNPTKKSFEHISNKRVKLKRNEKGSKLGQVGHKQEQHAIALA